MPAMPLAALRGSAVLEGRAALVLHQYFGGTCQSHSALQVLMVRDGMAIVEGLKNDAPIGTELAFVSGASG